MDDWFDCVNNYLVNFTDFNTGRTASGICDQDAIVGKKDGNVLASAGLRFKHLYPRH